MITSRVGHGYDPEFAIQMIMRLDSMYRDVDSMRMHRCQCGFLIEESVRWVSENVQCDESVAVILDI
jgi:hypothetical protein